VCVCVCVYWFVCVKRYQDPARPVGGDSGMCACVRVCMCVCVSER